MRQPFSPFLSRGFSSLAVESPFIFQLELLFTPKVCNQRTKRSQWLPSRTLLRKYHPTTPVGDDACSRLPPASPARCSPIPLAFVGLLSLDRKTIYPSSKFGRVVNARGFALTWSWPDSELELKDNTVIVVLGASGDLAKKKTVRPSPSNAQQPFVHVKVAC